MSRLLHRGSSISITMSLGRAFRAAWPTTQSRVASWGVALWGQTSPRLSPTKLKPHHHRLDSRLLSVLFCSILGRLRCTPFGSNVAKSPSHELIHQEEAGVVLALSMHQDRETLGSYRDCPARRGWIEPGFPSGAVSIGSFELSFWRLRWTR